MLIDARPDSSDNLIFGLNEATPTLYHDALGTFIDAGSGVDVTTGAWWLIGVSKPEGEEPIRFHRVRLSDGSASHADAVGAPAPDVPDPYTGVAWGIGGYRGIDDPDFEGLIAAVAVWNVHLGDADFAAMKSWTGIFGRAPRAIWRLDGSDPFADQTGRDNDQLPTGGLTGTSHSADDPSGFWPVDTTGRSYGGYGSNNWPPASWRPYRSTSIWNRPVDPAVDVVHPNSAAMVTQILALHERGAPPVGHLVAGRADTDGDYSHPLYFAREDDPWFTLDFAYHNAPGWGPHSLQGTRLQIPDLARPAGGSDHHLVVVQPPERDGSGNYVRDSAGNHVYWEYDLWDVTSKPAGGGTLRCGWGGRHDFQGDGFGPGANGTAARFGLVAGTIRANELVAGLIDHALFAVVRVGAGPNDLDFGYGTRRGDSENGSFVWPATHGDAFDENDDGIPDFADVPPMGARLWLDMSELAIEGLRLPAWKTTILKALARYGAYFGDTGGPGLGFQFDGGQAYTSFGVADPLVAYAADNGFRPSGQDFVFDLSADSSGWLSSLRVLVPPEGPYAAAVRADDPVAWWRLGEASGTTARDRAGSNHGTASGSVTRGVATILPGSGDGDPASSFNGTSGTIAIPDHSSLDVVAPVTVEAWIKPTALPGSGDFASIVTKAEAWSLQFNAGRLEFTIMRSGTRYRLQASSGTIVAGSVYHVAGTYDGTTQRLYVNGTQVASAALSAAVGTSANAVAIGSWSGGGEWYWGTIDEVAVYDTALSAARVRAHHEAGTSVIS